MAAPENQDIILSPPHPPGRFDNFMDLGNYLSIMYNFNYHLWQRVGGYESTTPDLSKVKVSADEINTLLGIKTGITVQQQLDEKADSSSLGTIAAQDYDNVFITGGSIDNVNFDSGQWDNGTINNATLNSVTIDGTSISNCSFSDGTISDSNITIPMGSSTSDLPIGGTANVNTTQVGNVGSGEDTLISYSLPANSLSANHNYLEVSAWGTVAANANNKRIKLYFGSTALIDTGSVAANSGSWYIEAKIVRIGSSSEQAISKIISENSLIINKSSLVSPAEDTASSINIYCTGEGTNDNDIIQNGLLVKWYK